MDVRAVSGLMRRAAIWLLAAVPLAGQTIFNPHQRSAHAVNVQVHAHTDIYSPGELLKMYRLIWGAGGSVGDKDKDGDPGGDPGVPDIVWLYGVEETVGAGASEGGPGQHLGSIGIELNQSATAIQKAIDGITAAGGIASVHHPNMAGREWPRELLERTAGYRLLEIYNATLGLNNYAEDKWDYILSLGRMVWGAAADDFKWQFSGCVGRGYIEVSTDSADLSGILAAIRAGNFYARQGKWNPPGGYVRLGKSDLSCAPPGRVCIAGRSHGFHGGEYLDTPEYGYLKQVTRIIDDHRFEIDSAFNAYRYPRAGDGKEWGEFRPANWSAGPDLRVTVEGKTIVAATTAGTGTFRWVKKGGAAAKADSAETAADRYTVAGDEEYVRVVFTRAADSLRVWSQPLQVRKQ